MKNSSETYNYFKEAETRQISDWLVGMNYSPFLSLHMQSKGLNGIWSVGRVQTPTNTLICENYLERENFKEQPYWLLRGLSKNNDDEVKFAHDIKDNQFFDKEALNQYIENYQLNQCNHAIVSNVETSQKQKESPKLFSLGALQSYCSNKFGWTASQTLKEIQTLYDKGYISYPRTSSQFITQNEFSYLNTKKEDYKALLGLSVKFTQTSPRKRYVNDEKVLEHYAIIPTDELPNLSDLSSNSQKLYEVIVRNTLAMFCDNHQYEETVIHVMANKVPFKTKGIVVLNHGWKSIISEDSDKKDDEAKELPAYQVDQSIPFRVIVEDKMTKPPAQITEAKLVGENGLMKKLGLGTEATRSGIIETLKERQYIQNDGKTKLKPTTKGLLLYESTKNSLIGSPEMTAKWEERLETIGKGESAPENFIAQIKSSIEPTFEKIQSQKLPVHYIEQLSDNQSFKVGKYTVLEKNKLFEATPDDESEVVLLWKSIAGAKLTKKEVEELLTNGKTKTKKKGLKSKNGKSFSAYLLLDNGKVSFSFE